MIGAVSMSSADQLRVTLREALAAFPQVRLGLLFGSHARGTADNHSDVDVAVQAPASEGQACGRVVDVVILDDPPIPLLDALIRDSAVIFEAVPGTGASWRSSTLSTLELDRPWYQRTSTAWLARVAREGLPGSTTP
jgi:hypothetical protein